MDYPHTLPRAVAVRATMTLDVDVLRMVLQSQLAGAEAALSELEAAAGRGAIDGSGTESTASARRVDDAAVRALATTVLDDMATWSEMWRGVANRGAAPAPSSASTLEGENTTDEVKPRKMMGVSPMMGMGTSGLGELKSAIGNRKSAPGPMESRDEREKIGAGVVVVPVTATVSNQSAGKPDWMLELAAKKKTKADAEVALGL